MLVDCKHRQECRITWQRVRREGSGGEKRERWKSERRVRGGVREKGEVKRGGIERRGWSEERGRGESESEEGE